MIYTRVPVYFNEHSGMPAVCQRLACQVLGRRACACNDLHVGSVTGSATEVTVLPSKWGVCSDGGQGLAVSRG